MCSIYLKLNYDIDYSLSPTYLDQPGDSLLCVCLSPHTIAHPSPVLQRTRLVASACVNTWTAGEIPSVGVPTSGERTVPSSIIHSNSCTSLSSPFHRRNPVLPLIPSRFDFSCYTCEHVLSKLSASTWNFSYAYVSQRDSHFEKTRCSLLADARERIEQWETSATRPRLVFSATDT